MDQEYHQMVLEEVHPSGEEIWNCPTCGRRFSVNWEPKFKRTILEAGDEYASHSGSKGGLQMGSMRTMPTDNSFPEEKQVISLEDPRLAPWKTWLDKVDFENLWNNEI